MSENNDQVALEASSSPIFRKPRFPGADVEAALGNSLADDMWKAFLNETGADLTITCENFLVDDEEDQETNELSEQKPARATFR